MNLINKFFHYIGVAITLFKGQVFLFPRLNLIGLRIYGRLRIRGKKINIKFGRNVKFLGDAIIVNSYNSLDKTVFFGDNVIIEDNVYINSHGGYINIMSGVFIGVSSIIQGKGGINIGQNSMLGPNVQIYSSDHQIEIGSIPYINQPELSSSVTIGENVWVGAGSIILRGSIISSNSVIAAGSVLKIKTTSPSFIYRANGLANSLRELS